MSGGRELFIYYRAPVADAAALLAQVCAFQKKWQAQVPGLQTRLLRRPAASEGWHTWMETYALPDDPHGVTETLEQNIESSARELPIHAQCTTRHVESFRPCA